MAHARRSFLPLPQSLNGERTADAAAASAAAAVASPRPRDSVYQCAGHNMTCALLPSADAGVWVGGCVGVLVRGVCMCVCVCVCVYTSTIRVLIRGVVRQAWWRRSRCMQPGPGRCGASPACRVIKVQAQARSCCRFQTLRLMSSHLSSR